VGGQRHALANLLPGERPGTHFRGGWVGLGVGYKGTENLDATSIRTPDRPAYYRVPHNRFSV